MSYIASDIKDMNRKIVYNLLLSRGEMSKAEISRETGISAPTVIKIIDYLKKIGCVRDVGEGKSAIGRKPNLLRFDPAAGYAIGVDFSGVEIKAGIVDFGGNLCYLEKLPAASSFNEVMNSDFPGRIKRLIKKSAVPPERIRGICIGVPGVVNSDQKTIELAPLVGIIKKTDYGEAASNMANSLKMPVIFENDANVAVIGEFNARKYAPDDDLLFITIGKGLGAGIILNGKLRKGKNYYAGELGYMVFSKNYRIRETKAGWLEVKIRLDELRRETDINTDSLDNLACNLALAIVNICNPFEISHVVLGKFKSEDFYRLLIERINSYLHSFSMLNIKCEPSVCSEPAVLGGAHIIIESVLDDLFGA